MRRQRNFAKPMTVTYIDTRGEVFQARFNKPPTIEQIVTCNSGQRSVFAIRPVNRTIVNCDGVNQYGYWWVIDLNKIQWIEIGPELREYRSGKPWRNRVIQEPRKDERITFDSYDVALAFVRLMT